jgi:hypothetical protein
MIALRRLYFSFPLRLLVFHVRNHLILMSLWLFLGLLITGAVGRFYGMHYLLLTPEYRGAVDFWSFFLTGAALGAFLMIWHLTTYLLCANRFPFLATLEAPFTKFALNNSLIPLFFLGTYLAATVWFQWHDEFTSHAAILRNVSGLLAGMAALVLLLAGYLYFTNKDIGAFLRPGGKFMPKPGGRTLVRGQRLPTIGEIQTWAVRWRVDSYLNERLRLRPVRSVAHYRPELLEVVFRQNHFNAVVVQGLALALLLFLGSFMEEEWARIPTAATIFILASMVLALFGAITFWFRQWGTLAFFIVLLAVNYLTGWGFLQHRNPAYGLNYAPEQRVAYTNDAFEAMCGPEQLRRDKAATQAILERWLAKNRAAGVEKPKMVFICVSGGGMRAALWAMQSIQQADIATQGRLLRQTALITGASGGMLGAAYLREAMLREQQGDSISAHDLALQEDMGKDLLNPVSFAVVANDLFFPLERFQSGKYHYRKDRGYLFEHQLNENCRGLLQRKLGAYRRPEKQARIPMMIVSPFVLNDARRLLISPQGVSYLMRPGAGTRMAAQVAVDGVDFGRLCAGQDADSLAFSTALRMNCTYPFILPNVWLPTKPAVEIMDAGFRDNYGLGLAVRFVQTFQDWIQANTGGVLFLQIRCWEKERPIPQSDYKGIVENIFNPANAAANLSTVQDYELDNALSLLHDALGGGQQLQVLRFVYRPVRKQREASMSLHLSKREKLDIRESFFRPENQANLGALRRMMGD